MSSGPSRSSATDSFTAALRQAVAVVADAVQKTGASNAVVLIDGRSGSGKTSLTRDLVAQWPSPGRVQAVALDSLYPGWDGLDDGAAIARDRILIPHARGLIGVWRRWDWGAGEAAEAHAVDPSLPLVVEGSGVLNPRTARLADVRVWLESPPDARRRRALDRDGDSYRPHWERWAAQEEVHLARDFPQRHATLIIDLP